MDTSLITTPQELGKILKAEFKKLGIIISTRYIKTVRGLDGSWYEITTFVSGHIIPNDLRREFVCLNYDKPFEELNISQPDDIRFGNIEAKSVALHGRDWKKWLETRS